MEKKLTRQLDAGLLEALLESARLLHGSLELENLLKHLLRSVMGRLVATKGFVALDTNGRMAVAIARGLKSFAAGTPIDRDSAESAGIDLVLPIGEPSDPVGLLGVSRPLAGEVAREERDFLDALLGLAASAVANARAHDESRRLNLELDRKVHQLETLLDLVRGLARALDPDEVARMLGRTLAGQWLILKYMVAAFKPGHPDVLLRRGMILDAPESLIEPIAEVKQAVRVEELPEDAPRSALEAGGAALLVPLRSGEEALGFVALGPRAGGEGFSASDLELLSGLGAQAVVALENSWHFRETLEKRKIEEELALAASIQERLFPSAIPELDGFDVAARSRPARQVGGDYYDVIPVKSKGPGEPHLLCVADVSGKGIAASLLMSNVQANIRALLVAGHPLADLVAETNDLIFAASPGNKFVTAILISADPASGRCRFVNAGHNRGILLRAAGRAPDEVEFLEPSGVPIGLLPGQRYRETELEMRPGDLVAIFSDGVTEANDPDGNELEEERLLACLRSVAGRSAEEIVAAVFDEVDRFAGEAPQYDDITLMVVRRRPG